MTFKEFLKTRTFRINALAVVGITTLLLVVNMFAIRIYTDHGHSIAIPDLRGKTGSQMNAIARNSDLRIAVRDSVYSHETAPGTVVDQFPKPGMKVKKNRTIFVTMCAISQEMIPMPQLTDISYRQATNLIESSGLIAGNIEYKPSEFPNLVLEQKINGRNIEVGERVAKGSVVDLVLGGDNTGATSEVPTLFGRNLTEARMVLGEAFLNVGKITYDDSIPTDDQKLKSLIWKQNPDPAEVFEVAHGTPIDLWLTTDTTKLHVKTEVKQPDNSFF